MWHGCTVRALAAVGLAAAGAGAAEREAHLRVNLAGYAAGQPVVVTAFAARPLGGTATVTAADGARVAWKGRIPAARGPAWGAFAYHHDVVIPPLPAGSYRVRLGRSGPEAAFQVTADPVRALIAPMLGFLRQQRCGYNPFLDVVCHAYDGRSAYGPLPPGSYVDARGGWHDAGDQLKYLLTTSTAVAQLLLAHRIAPHAFDDDYDALGRPGANGEADVLDEARWGLDWMLRLHPTPDTLVHQVADDRDHIGWKFPDRDTSDYGWGPGRERVAYFADGKPQGLGKFQSVSDGVANLAGRYAAAMALAHRAWERRDPAFAARCLRAGREVYAMGRAAEGVQQGNSFGAPYRYGEETWADDMEWGAAELFASTAEPQLLDDARRYARVIGSTSAVGRDSAAHYQYYPFLNTGHFALAAQARDASLGAELAGYYREGLAAAARMAAGRAWGVGSPFMWCSNNFVVGAAIQALLLERMTGARAHRRLAVDHLDWLLGRNPWGTSMLTRLPAGATAPRDPHLSTTQLTGRPLAGGLVDGPVLASIFSALEGVTLSRPDAFAAFQGEAVYHDDASDYATNEPTMDGTASAVLLAALWSDTLDDERNPPEAVRSR